MVEKGHPRRAPRRTRGTAGAPPGHPGGPQGTPGSPPRHPQGTSGTPPGDPRDTLKAPPGDPLETPGALPGHPRDTLGIPGAPPGDPGVNNSIDCGVQPDVTSYTEKVTGLNFVSDGTFVDTGESKMILEKYKGFLYGDYDRQDMPPSFDLYIGSDLWDTVNISYSKNAVDKEVIHIPPQNHMLVCLANTGHGIPLNFKLKRAGSLALAGRWDVGSSSGYR
ncbi:hypothetical protein L484_025661 [Morus notabilis]|uniref:Malectin-like domain-containing protein n=1 Tax=Morus notabilis TaxID=981085 RepID=W9RH11_9ROSA|nr:hypothetical protein L484_025661 [Morus notabilis]